MVCICCMLQHADTTTVWWQKACATPEMHYARVQQWFHRVHKCAPSMLALQSCNLVGKPVLITRVVDTMAISPRPTRAEATGELITSCNKTLVQACCHASVTGSPQYVTTLLCIDGNMSLRPARCKRASRYCS